MQIQKQWDTTSHALGWLEWKRQTASSGSDVEKLQPSFTASGNRKWCGRCGNSWAFPRKLNVELPYDAAIPLAGVYARVAQKHVHQHYAASLIMETTHRPITWRRGEQNVVYPWHRILLIYKKKWSSGPCHNTVNLENVLQSESSPTQKLLIVWFHFYDVPRKDRSIETENRLVAASLWWWE